MRPERPAGASGRIAVPHRRSAPAFRTGVPRLRPVQLADDCGHLSAPHGPKCTPDRNVKVLTTLERPEEHRLLLR